MKARTAVLAAAALVFIVLLISQSRIYWVAPAWLILAPICLAVGYIVWRVSKR